MKPLISALLVLCLLAATTGGPILSGPQATQRHRVDLPSLGSLPGGATAGLTLDRRTASNAFEGRFQESLAVWIASCQGCGTFTTFLEQASAGVSHRTDRATFPIRAPPTPPQPQA